MFHSTFTQASELETGQLTASNSSLLFPLQGLTAVDFTDDSSLIAGGFADSTVRVWSVTPKKLRKVKSAAGTAQGRTLMNDGTTSPDAVLTFYNKLFSLFLKT